VIIAEKVEPESPVTVGFTDLSLSGKNSPIEAKLEEALRQEWPSLKVTYRSDTP
jgi:hypothetical protein